MLPDPLALRVAAGALTATGGEVRRLCAELASTLDAVRWSAPAADVVRRGLATAQAGALTGGAGLEAGAAHLRALAVAVEQLGDDMRRLHDQAADALRAQIAADPGGLVDHTVQGELDRLPPPDDPTWARRAGARPLALPEPGRVPEPAVAPGSPGLVFAVPDEVGRLSGRCRSTASSVSAACDGTRARVGALGLPALDAYGLAGSRSEQWLRAHAEPGAPLAAAAGRWELAARECDLLVRLLALADRPGELLVDPRLLEALAALAAQLAGPAALQAELAALSPADRGWVLDMVPGLLPPAPPAPSPGLAPPSPVDLTDWARQLLQLPRDVVEVVDDRMVALWNEAARLRAAAGALTGEAAAQTRDAARAAVRAASGFRLRTLRLRAVADRLRLPEGLRIPLGAGHLLGSLDRAGGVLALLGLVADLAQGMPVPVALVKTATLLGVGYAAGAGVVAVLGLFATAPLWGPGAVVVGGIAATFLAGYLFDRFAAPALGQAVGRAAGGLAAGRRVAGSTAHAAGRALTREARRVRSLLGRIGHLGPATSPAPTSFAPSSGVGPARPRVPVRAVATVTRVRA